MKDTYESFKSGKLVESYYNSVKGGVVTTYTGLRDGISNTYEGMVTKASGKSLYVNVRSTRSLTQQLPTYVGSIFFPLLVCM